MLTPPPPPPRAYFIVRIQSYEGDDSALACVVDGQPAEAMYAVVVVADGRAAVVDYGYPSLSDAGAAWPEAAPCLQG